MNKRCIIVGASHAAAQLCVSLRQAGWSGDILMIGDEPQLPYHRPPLSKALLAGEKTVEDIVIRPATFYAKQNIRFQQGRVTALDRIQKMLTLADGSQLNYDKLALCTGARVRRIAVPGAELAGVHYLRNLADVQGIQQHIGVGKRAVIIGGGYIGLEAAASLRKQGMRVTVLEMAERILQRVTAPAVSAFYQRIHTEEGVDVHTGSLVQEIVGNGQVEKVVCADGVAHAADLVIVGIGVLPNTELAEAAGLPVDNGIVVNEFCQTSDADIVAAGDVVNHYDPRYGTRLRLESVPNAMEQAKSAAAALCGQQKAYGSLPWFWSDQYDMKLQIAGLSHGYDEVLIRGDVSNGRSFAAFYLKSGQLIAADCVNRPQEFVLSKKILGQGLAVDFTRLVDDAMLVKDILQ